MRIIACLSVRLILNYYSRRNCTCIHTNSLCTYSPYMCASVLTHRTCAHLFSLMGRAPDGRGGIQICVKIDSEESIRGSITKKRNSNICYSIPAPRNLAISSATRPQYSLNRASDSTLRAGFVRVNKLRMLGRPSALHMRSSS